MSYSWHLFFVGGSEKCFTPLRGIQQSDFIVKPLTTTDAYSNETNILICEIGHGITHVTFEPCKKLLLDNIG